MRARDRGTWQYSLPGGISFKGLKGNPVFAPLADNPSVTAALDAVSMDVSGRPRLMLGKGITAGSTPT